MKKRFQNKSQTEIMGLMIIFIIFSLIIVFIITTVFFKKPSTTLDEFNQQQLSSSIVSAFLKTNSYCLKDTDMKELIIASAKSLSLQCDPELLPQTKPPNPCLTYPDYPDAKAYLTCAFNQSLAKSLGTFNLPYELQIKIGQQKIIGLQSTNEAALKASKSGSVEPYVLPISGSAASTVEIWLCVNSRCPKI